MAAKTFVPALVRLLNKACKYIAKHHDTMALYLSSTQMTALDAVNAACVAFTTLVPVHPEEP